MTDGERMIWVAAFVGAMGEGSGNMPIDLFAIQHAELCVRTFRTMKSKGGLPWDPGNEHPAYAMLREMRGDAKPNKIDGTSDSDLDVPLRRTDHEERARLLTKFASGLLDRLGDYPDRYSARVIADWRAEMDKFGR